MPKPKLKAGTVFSVTPWQDRPPDGVTQQTQPIVQAGYNEVELLLVVAASPADGGERRPAKPQAQQDGCSADMRDAMAVDVQPPACLGQAEREGAQQQQPAWAEQAAGASGQGLASTTAPAAAAPLAVGAGWVPKRRKIEAEQAADIIVESELVSGAVSSDSDLSSCPLPAGGVAGADAAQGDPDRQHGQLELAGTGYLALLPNGSITGHLVLPPSAFAPGRRRSLGVMGEVVVAGRECTRDADWGVLRMTLVSFGCGSGGGGGGSGGGQAGSTISSSGSVTSAGEVSFLAERTEGDAMCLRAPVPWQGIEQEELPPLEATCTCPTSSGLALNFRCQQLLSGAAGEEALRRLQPSLVGKGAMLNVGELHIALPPEAAAVLMLPGGVLGDRKGLRSRDRHTALEGRGGSYGSGSKAPAGLAGVEAEQRLYTGGGTGGGRVVRDVGEDW